MEVVSGGLATLFQIFYLPGANGGLGYTRYVPGAQPERDKRYQTRPPKHRAKENCDVRYMVEKRREPILV